MSSQKFLLCIILLSFFSMVLSSSNKQVIRCLSNLSVNITNHLYTQTSPKFKTLFESTQQNTRWINTTESKAPLLILTPHFESEIRAAILCSKAHGLQVRVKTGGHDYEGLSFRSPKSYIIIDLLKFNQVDVDVTKKTAWIQAGVTLGELYYAIGTKSLKLAFPGGTCPSVGTTGLISGGGFGMLVRKYGLAADNIRDARIMNAEGHVLDKRTMGKELFWAIRGGGAASFGVVTAWKLRLVRIPETITVLRKSVILNQSGNAILHRWQYVAPRLPKELLIRVLILPTPPPLRNVKASFDGVFLGSKWKLLQVMMKQFPDLRLGAKECTEFPWINSTTSYFGNATTKLEKLLNRTDMLQQSYKAKSDFVTEPVPENVLQGIWNRVMQTPTPYVVLVMEPFGGRMDEISESRLPYPYRKGFLYNIQYIIKWNGNNATAETLSLKWVRELYEYMEPYVSKSPRGAYINYRDLDLGTNQLGVNTSSSEATHWGHKYFRANFQKLAEIKGHVDPQNFFNNEQSIPPL